MQNTFTYILYDCFSFIWKLEVMFMFKFVLFWGVFWVVCVYVFFTYFKFYCIIVDLQCYVNFCCAAKWFSHAYTHIHFLIRYHRILGGLSCVIQDHPAHHSGPCEDATRWWFTPGTYYPTVPGIAWPLLPLKPTYVHWVYRPESHYHEPYYLMSPRRI